MGRRPLEDALIEVPTMRRFAGINLISDRIPDETTILAFQHLLARHDLGKKIHCCAEDFVYETVNSHLKANGMAMKQGTIIDATLIGAPSSTKNEKKGKGSRDAPDQEGEPVVPLLRGRHRLGAHRA